jgi:hypothetical protein
MIKHVKFNENYHLLTQMIENNQQTVEVNKSVNYLICIDVSGSMHYELALIRQQLKNKIPTLMKEGDTITIIWFSGRNDSGILLEEVEIKSFKSFDMINSAIDRWLQPIGMTAFYKPLVLAKEAINRIKKNRANSLISMLFLSDGYNNDCSYGSVIEALKEIEKDLNASIIVEYGYNADSQKLTEMSAILGGSKVSSSDFDEYEPVFEKYLTSTISGGKKVEVDIKNDYLYDFAFSVSNDGSILLYNITNNKILINPDVKEIHYFSPIGVGDEHLPETVLYAATYLLSDKLLNEMAELVLVALKDNYHYKMLVNAYGKQKLNAFKNSIKECVEDPTKRFPEGKAGIKPVDENAYCLMNLMEDLGEQGILFYPNHSEFNYNRIGRKKVAKGSNLSEDDKKRLAEAKNVEEASIILKELEEKNVDLKFVNTELEKGYSLNDLVFNEERANLSVRLRVNGKVALPSNKHNLSEIDTYIWRTYTLIRDGILNIDKLPINYTPEIHTFLLSKSVKFTFDYDQETAEPKYIIIDLNSLPIINKSMVVSLSAKSLATHEWELLKIQGLSKTYRYYKDILFPKTSKSFVESYGQDCADWLKEIGITDFNGFAPKTDVEDSKDFYMSVNLILKLKNLSSFPKVLDVEKKLLENKSLKLNEWIMADAIKNYKAQTETEIYKSLSEEQQKEVLNTYLTQKFDELNKKKRELLQLKAQAVFSIILSKKWFKEFKSFDENQLNLKLDEQDLNFTFEIKEVEVKI